MGFLNHFYKPAPTLVRLPSGSFTVDREGSVLGGTLPSSFPPALVNDIGRQVLAAFHDAAKAKLTLSELIVNYPSLRIVATELRGGAIIYLTPKATDTPASAS